MPPVNVEISPSTASLPVGSPPLSAPRHGLETRPDGGSSSPGDDRAAELLEVAIDVFGEAGFAAAWRMIDRDTSPLARSRWILCWLSCFAVLVSTSIGVAAGSAMAEGVSDEAVAHAESRPFAISALLSGFDGHWARIEDEDSEAARLASIDEAVADLSWLVRRMAVGVLRKSVVPPGSIRFTWDGERLHQVVEGSNGTFRRPVDLGAAPQRLSDANGEDFDSEWHWTSRGLEVQWVQSQAFGSTLYRLDQQTHDMVVEHRIQVTALDDVRPIEYESRFDRSAMPAVSSAGLVGGDESSDTDL